MIEAAMGGSRGSLLREAKVESVSGVHEKGMAV